MRNRSRIVMALAALAFGALAMACAALTGTQQSPLLVGTPPLTNTAQASASPIQPAPSVTPAQSATKPPTATMEPVLPAPTETSGPPTAEPVLPPPTNTVALSATEPALQPTGVSEEASELPAATATAVDTHTVVITEGDVTQAIAGGAGSDNGATVENLAVRFTGGQTVITADSVDYGFLSVQNLAVVGQLEAVDGALQMNTVSVTPTSLVTAMVPDLINQALKSYSSRWYVEDVQTYKGYIVLHVR
jgi:hypothetical protein